MSNIVGYHSQAHFKMNEIELYFNLTPPPATAQLRFDKCPHIDKLFCSRAYELAPDKCITERKCELYLHRATLFRKLGIHGQSLLDLDKKLQEDR